MYRLLHSFIPESEVLGPAKKQLVYPIKFILKRTWYVYCIYKPRICIYIYVYLHIWSHMYVNINKCTVYIYHIHIYVYISIYTIYAHFLNHIYTYPRVLKAIFWRRLLQVLTLLFFVLLRSSSRSNNAASAWSSAPFTRNSWVRWKTWRVSVASWGIWKTTPEV